MSAAVTLIIGASAFTLNLLGDLPELQRHIHAGFLPDDQMNPASHLFLEALLRDVQFVLTHGERGHPVVAYSVGNGAARFPGLHILSYNGRAGHRRSRRVRHSARNGGGDLRPSRRSGQQNKRAGSRRREHEQIPWNGAR